MTQSLLQATFLPNQLHLFSCRFVHWLLLGRGRPKQIKATTLLLQTHNVGSITQRRTVLKDQTAYKYLKNCASNFYMKLLSEIIAAERRGTNCPGQQNH